MGKKKDVASLGRAVIKDRFKSRQRKPGNSHLHTTELDDGYDWNKINLKSVTEENTLDEFLNTAEMAGTEFTAEKMNFTIVTETKSIGLLSEEEEKKVKATHESHRQLLKIPRRPAWDDSTTAEELDMKERDSFLEWRRSLAKLQEIDGIIMTPFERNLEFWRQLWRVIERSDVLVQIVDARNPQLFRCEDLELYVKEVDSDKVNMVLINKADLLSEEQREMWVKHFNSLNLKIAFWSAVNEIERIKLEAAAAGLSQSDEDANDSDSYDDDSDSVEEEQEEEEQEDVDEDKDLDIKDVKGQTNSNTANISTDKTATNNADKNKMSFDTSVTAKNEVTKDIKDQIDNQNTNASAKQSAIDQKKVSFYTSATEKTDKQVLPDKDHVSDNEIDNDEYNVEDDDGEWEDVESDESDEENIEPVKEQKLSTRDSTGSCNKDSGNSSSKTNSAEKNLEQTSTAPVSHIGEPASASSGDRCKTEQIQNSTQILSGHELIELFRSLHKPRHTAKDSELLTVGLVGYPNVGKSSTVNALLQTKKVPVSATPGRTKHFQTLFLDPTLMLCDCPGLVMPTFVSTKAEMITNGILPIDQMRDYVAPVSLVCRYVDRDILETVYGIMLPLPGETEDPNRHPTALELLTCHASVRGFMTHKGVPDYQRSARHILKDYVNGKLLYCYPPPDVTCETFKSSSHRTNKQKKQKPADSNTAAGGVKYCTSSIDDKFFAKPQPVVGSRGVGGVTNYTRRAGYNQHHSSSVQSLDDIKSSTTSIAEKPWKKHNNVKRKEKLRRVYGHLDA